MLVIDSGNTRTKIAGYLKGRQQFQFKVVNAELAMTLNESWLKELIQQLGSDLTCVGSSVGQPEAAEVITEKLQTVGIQVTWLNSQPALGSLRNGYGEDYGKLGADRWFALVGYFFGHHPGSSRAPSNALIVDAGTALTLDWLAADGEHLGGWIVPGRRLMQESLQQGTANLKGSLTEQCYRQPTQNTQQAMSHGVHFALVGAIAQAVDVADKLFAEQSYQLVVTGGDGERLVHSLQTQQRVNYQRIDDLVFKGLLVAADNL